MAINFPSTSGQATDGSFTHTASGITWAWDGTTWKASGSTGYSLPTAAANVKGGVKIGSGLTMTGETLSASVGATDKIEELNSSVEVIDTGTDGRVLITLDNEEKFEFNEAVDGKGGWLTLKGGGASGEGAKLTIDGGTGGGISFFNPKTTGGTEEYNLPTAYPTVSGQLLSATTGGAMSWVNSPSSEPEITWTLGANGSTDYTFTGSGFSSATNDPTLTLIRGQTYKFDNQTGGHPFRIQSTVASSGGGTAYNTGVTNNDATGGTATNVLTFVVPMDAPSTLYYQCTAHPGMTGTISILDQQSNLDSRSTFTGLTASLANNAAGNVSITAHKSYMLLKIKPSIAAWVTLYVDDASRTADASRVQGADPAPDAGVIAEVVTTAANQEIKMSPGVLGWHQDGGNDGVDTVFCKVVNKSGSTGTCTVSLTVVQLEA